MSHFRILVLAIVIVVASPLASAASIELAAVDGAARVLPDKPVTGSATATIAGARGEYESFQVVVTARDGNLRKGNASSTPLRSTDGKEIPASCIMLYCEVFVPLRHSVPRATEAPGLVPDPLVPFVNPYTGEAIPEPTWGDKGRVGP
ncbi:MAG: hypothetical protein IT364_16135, partial [Candidatus Hydrogenedentes bacterium]|nr:hypothetical protein [Candidatus Hydrogenedentota bacterium]